MYKRLFIYRNKLKKKCKLNTKFIVSLYIVILGRTTAVGD